MLRPLSVIRRRVERLATQARTGGCDGHHRRHRWVTVSGSEPVPAWPEREQGERCACGAELEYVTIVHQHIAGAYAESAVVCFQRVTR